MSTLCSEDALQGLVQDVQSSDQSGAIDRVDALLLAFPEDPRLHFLKGSMLISAGRLIEAHRAMSQAVTLAPDFAIARFQLGFFQLTSGEPENALETWGRLDRLPDDHYLRKFVDGLRCLIRDDFPGAIAHLADGIALNQENPPLNNDMGLLIDKCRDLAQTNALARDDGPVSETSLILRQFARGADDRSEDGEP